MSSFRRVRDVDSEFSPNPLRYGDELVYDVTLVAARLGLSKEWLRSRSGLTVNEGVYRRLLIDAKDVS